MGKLIKKSVTTTKSEKKPLEKVNKGSKKIKGNEADDSANVNLPDVVKESVETTEKIKVINTDSKKILKKKDKQKLKKDKILQKIELTKKSFKDEKDRKKREKTAVVGDMRPLLDSLPSLDSLYTITKSLHRQNAKKEPTTKRQKKLARIHTKTEQFLDRYDQLNQILNDPKFKKNPREMIAEKIRQRRLAEAQDNFNMES